MRRHLLVLSAAAGLMAGAVSRAECAESAFGSYGLGGNAFNAGVTPPPGTYISTVVGFYHADISGALQFQGITLNAGAKIDFFTSALAALYVPDRKVLGGNLGLSVTVPIGHIGFSAAVGALGSTVQREVDGWGLGDMIARAQLGWQNGDFSHTIWLQGVAPTGRYDNGFAPNIGLNRPGIDTGIAFTWTDKKTKLQFNGAVGLTFNFENEATDYRTGTEFHFEWAIGREISKGLTIGIAGYDYRQLTADSGPGAILGSFKSQVDAIGPALSYSTVIGTTAVSLDLRYYQEFNAEHRFEGNQTVGSVTLRF